MKNHRTAQLLLMACLCALGTHLTARADTESGLVAKYSFKGNARDASGRGHHGVAAGAFLTEDRFLNPRQAYAFSGDNSRIRVPARPGLNVGASGITLAAWVYPAQFSGQGERRTILRKMEPTGGTGGYLLALNGSGAPQFGFRADSPQYYEITGATALPTNEWSHLVLSYDGSLAKFFVNGVEVASAAQSVMVAPSASGLTIGQLGWTNNTDNFVGALDEIRIYDRALSNPDVLELFRNENNQAPDARILVLPRSAFSPSKRHVLISPNAGPVVVTLNGLRSEDPGDELEYGWYYHGNLFATGAVTRTSLALGSHPITLQVTDGVAVAEDSVTIDVLTVPEAIGALAMMIESAELNPGRKRNLLATLNQASRSSENNRLVSRLNQQLTVFQNKVKAQLSRSHPQLAAELVSGSRAILAAANRR